MTELGHQIKTIAADILQIDPGKLADNATTDELDIDSLDCVEIALAVEEKLGAFISDEELSKIFTLTDLIETVERLSNKRPTP